MRILVVEDEPAAANVLAKGLREHAYAVDIAADGAAALDQLSFTEYDLVILDVLLPRIQGHALRLHPVYIVAFLLVFGSAFGLLGAILAWQIYSGIEFEPEQAEDTDAGVGTRKLSLLLATIAVALPVAGIETFGFGIVAALSFAMIAAALGSTTHVRNLVGGLALSSFTWWAFSALGVQLGAYLPLAAR